MKTIKATRTMTPVQLDAELRKMSKRNPGTDSPVVPLSLAQRAAELRADLPYGTNPQEIANLWVEEQQKWPHRDVWFLGVRVLHVPRCIQPIVIEPSR